MKKVKDASDLLDEIHLLRGLVETTVDYAMNNLNSGTHAEDVVMGNLLMMQERFETVDDTLDTGVDLSVLVTLSPKR